MVYAASWFIAYSLPTFCQSWDRKFIRLQLVKTVIHELILCPSKDFRDVSYSIPPKMCEFRRLPKVPPLDISPSYLMTIESLQGQQMRVWDGKFQCGEASELGTSKIPQQNSPPTHFVSTPAFAGFLPASSHLWPSQAEEVVAKVPKPDFQGT